MSDLDSRCEKCEQEIEQLRGDLDALRLEIIGLVEGVLGRVDEVLVTVKSNNRQMFSDLQAQTDRGFARLQARIDALPMPLSERKNDEPPKLN
jgi:rRNA processing protein Gar1